MKNKIVALILAVTMAGVTGCGAVSTSENLPTEAASLASEVAGSETENTEAAEETASSEAAVSDEAAKASIEAVQAAEQHQQEIMTQRTQAIKTWYAYRQCSFSY